MLLHAGKMLDLFSFQSSHTAKQYFDVALQGPNKLLICRVILCKVGEHIIGCLVLAKWFVCCYVKTKDDKTLTLLLFSCRSMGVFPLFWE
jgi:hypothetical protein